VIVPSGFILLLALESHMQIQRIRNYMTKIYVMMSSAFVKTQRRKQDTRYVVLKDMEI